MRFSSLALRVLQSEAAAYPSPSFWNRNGRCFAGVVLSANFFSLVPRFFLPFPTSKKPGRTKTESAVARRCEPSNLHTTLVAILKTAHAKCLYTRYISTFRMTRPFHSSARFNANRASTLHGHEIRFRADSRILPRNKSCSDRWWMAHAVLIVPRHEETIERSSISKGLLIILRFLYLARIFREGGFSKADHLRSREWHTTRLIVCKSVENNGWGKSREKGLCIEARGSSLRVVGLFFGIREAKKFK